ncbi:MAG TPA: class I SAM-dependent methyltransferase [Acidimicrobiales bacterium]|nr:class I SAM-dependent methyltransferase [Acidimicrobiales bacterium]
MELYAGPKPDRFDAQADGFDARVGLPVGAAEAVAGAVIEVVAPGPEDLLVELGAGTGEIGQYLAQSVRYLAMDRSSRMLDIFRARFAEAGGRRVELLHADADRRWPLDDGSVAAVFASRAAHLLDADHLASELLRVCRPGSYFLVGRVIRDKDGVKSRLRRQRKLLLAQLGLALEDADGSIQRVLDRLVGAGAYRLEARTVTKWTATASVHQILDEWKAIGATGGQRMDEAARAVVMDKLANWADRELGDPHSVRTWTEQYVLKGVRTSTNRC